MPLPPTVTIRRQHRASLMMRVVPGGVEVYIPRYLKPTNAKVQQFIEQGLVKLGEKIPPVPTEQTSRVQIEEMVRVWAGRLGVEPGRITFRDMRRKRRCRQRSGGDDGGAFRKAIHALPN